MKRSKLTWTGSLRYEELHVLRIYFIVLWIRLVVSIRDFSTALLLQPQSSLCFGGLGSAIRSCHGSSTRGRRSLILAACVIAYALLGAGGFSSLERPTVIERERRAAEMLRQFLDRNPCVDPASVEALLTGLGALLPDMTSVGPNGTVAASSRWDFGSSLYFSMTVITTIGYGNMAPSTGLGRLFCCIYALLGIPLLALLLTSMADRLKELARWSYGLGCWRGRDGLARATLILMYILIGTLLCFVVPSLAFTVLEDWPFLIGIYFCVISLTTIGFGDYIPAQKSESVPYRTLLAVWTLAGLVYVSGLVSGVQLLMQKATESLVRRTTRGDRVGDAAGKEAANFEGDSSGLGCGGLCGGELAVRSAGTIDDGGGKGDSGDGLPVFGGHVLSQRASLPHQA